MTITEPHVLPQLTSLEAVQKSLAADGRRSTAAGALLRSGQRRISMEHRSSVLPSILGNPVLEGKLQQPAGACRRASSAPRPTSASQLDPKFLGASRRSGAAAFSGSSKNALQEAFLAHVRSFGEDSNTMTMSVDAVILLLTKCGLFDEWLMPNMVRVYCTYLAEGCNELASLNDIDSFGEDDDSSSSSDGLAFSDFEALLRWVADVKGVTFEDCAGRVLQLVTAGCDGASSMRRKLEVIFQMCVSKPDTERMTVYEFTCLCRRWDLFRDGQFCVGDIYALFILNGEGGSVDFAGFVQVLAEVGEKLGVGREIYNMLADRLFKMKTTQAAQPQSQSPKALRNGQGPDAVGPEVAGAPQPGSPEGGKTPRTYAARFVVNLGRQASH